MFDGHSHHLNIKQVLKHSQDVYAQYHALVQSSHDESFGDLYEEHDSEFYIHPAFVLNILVICLAVNVQICLLCLWRLFIKFVCAL